LMPLAYGVVLGQIEVSGLLTVVGGLIAVASVAYLLTLTPVLSRRRSDARTQS